MHYCIYIIWQNETESSNFEKLMYNFRLDTSHSTLISFLFSGVNFMPTKVRVKVCVTILPSPNPTCGVILSILLLLGSIVCYNSLIIYSCDIVSSKQTSQSTIQRVRELYKAPDYNAHQQSE